MSAADDILDLMLKEPKSSLDSAVVALLLKSLQAGNTALQNDIRALREENALTFNSISVRVNKVEEVCTKFEVLKGGLVNEKALLEAKIDVVETAKSEDGKIIEMLNEISVKLSTLEDKFKIFDFSWCKIKRVMIENRWLLGAVTTVSGVLFLILLEVTIGRLKDFGII